MTVADRRTGSFIATSEYRRFVEFARTVRSHATIGLCHGPAGVGKTLSARRYAHWDLAEPLLTSCPRAPSDAKVHEAVARARTLFFTPPVAGTLRSLRRDFVQLTHRVNACIEEGLGRDPDRRPRSPMDLIELVIVDESERLTTTSLEYLRDQFDRNRIGLVLIGMPGIEKRMGHYPQLYSRVGFPHHYAPLSRDELEFVLARHWRRLYEQIEADDFTSARATAAIARLTRGNFRLLQRLFVQIDRVLRINELSAISEEVVETAASALVIGYAT